jgi:hypothetical protein
LESSQDLERFGMADDPRSGLLAESLAEARTRIREIRETGVEETRLLDSLCHEATGSRLAVAGLVLGAGLTATATTAFVLRGRS